MNKQSKLKKSHSNKHKLNTDIEWQYFLKVTQILLLQTSLGNLDCKMKCYIKQK